MRALPTPELVIRFAPGLWDIYDGSIRRRPPEQYAVLAGRYDDPFRVTDFRPMPPLPDASGKPNAGATHVQINKSYIDHYINNELKPAGKSMVGAIHSHPGQYKVLSGGYGDDGDIPSMRGTLKRAQDLGWPWEYFLAPIVTFNADQSADELTGWVIRLEERNPIPAKIVFEEGTQTSRSDFPTEDSDILPEVINHLDRYQAWINKILRDTSSPQEDRDFALTILRRIRTADLEEVEAAAIDRIRRQGHR